MLLFDRPIDTDEFGRIDINVERLVRDASYQDIVSDSGGSPKGLTQLSLISDVSEDPGRGQNKN